jgi:hypothetical protein
VFADAQSPFALHAVLQAVALAQTKPPGQAAPAPALQVPLPLQVPIGVRMPFAQAAAPQAVPAA